jgi:hypothetical protein
MGYLGKWISEGKCSWTEFEAIAARLGAADSITSRVEHIGDNSEVRKQFRAHGKWYQCNGLHLWTRPDDYGKSLKPMRKR